MPANLDSARRLVVADHGLAVVSTTRADGSVHSSLVNAGVLADPVNGEDSVAFVAVGGARKLELLRHTGKATITFRVGWQWASVDGPARVIGPDDPAEGFDPAALPGLLREIFTAAGGTHEDFDEFDRVMAAERRAAVFIAARRVMGHAST